LAKSKPVPRDLAFFLASEVFPGLPRRVLEEALSCSELVYIPKSSRRRLVGVVVVYAGSVHAGSMVYTRGDYLRAEGPVEAEEDSVVLVFPGECGRLIEAALASTEACSVGELVHRRPVCVEPGTRCIDAVRVMAENGVSSVLVCSDGRALAIFTDTDLRRVVAETGGYVPDKPVEECGTPDPLSVPAPAGCTEAAMVMMERYVKHLVVTGEDGRVRGVVTVRDIAYAEALGPLYGRRLIAAASSPEELAEAYRRLLRMLRRSMARLQPASSPGPGEHYARMASLALRSVAERTARLAAKRLGVGQEGWAYIASGSLARQEQPLPTDRDTMLVYRPGSLGEARARRLAEEIETLLDRIGYPGCSEGHTSLRHLYALDEAKDLLRRAAARPQDGDNIVLLGLAMDAVDVWPRSGLGDEIRRTAYQAVEAAGSGPAVRSMLAAYRPRLGLLGRLPRRLDLKRDALAPLTYAAKALTASTGLWEPVNTGERILALASREALPPDLAEDTLEAYRVVLGYTAWALASTGSRTLDTGELTGLERQQLRAALLAAARLVDRARAPG
jgi:CBS domain-containing protein